MDTPDYNIYDPSVEPVVELSGRKKKLWELHIKLNEARKLNRRELQNEREKLNKSKTNEANSEISQKRKEQQQKQKEERDSKIKKGIDPDTEALMNEPLEIAQQNYVEKKQRDPSGWDAYYQKQYFNSYQKRVKNIKPPPETTHSINQKSLETIDSNLDSSSGRIIKDKPQNIEYMVNELKEITEKRKNKKRKAFYDEEDISYINERNRVFNKRLDKAFGRYTREIRANLERGTAL